MSQRLLALLLISIVGLAADAETKRPNVLFIAVDDLNDWIGCLQGHPQASTPNMDRLAARGVLFANAHCAAPACNPSRAAVFSGRMPQATGVWANDASSLADYPQAKPIPIAFKELGYRTMGTGKLLHKKGKSLFEDYYSVEQRWSPFSKGAVEYSRDELPSKGSQHPHHTFVYKGKAYTLPLNRMPSDRAPQQVKAESFDWGPFDLPDAEFGDTKITDWAIKQIESTQSKPFFLGVGYYRPHIPLWAPKRFFDRFSDSPGVLPATRTSDLDDLGSMGRQWALEPVTAGAHATVVKYKQWQAAVEAYLACVSYVDHEIGRLLDALAASSHRNTVIILWSDHGWQLGEKQHWGKWTGWERSTKVPLIIVPPSAQLSSVGATCQQPVSLIDLYPTLLELCRAKPTTELDGRSLVPLLKDPQQATDRAVVTMFNPGNGSLRTDRFRYIEYANGEQELYDLQSDPNEFENLASSRQHVEVKHKLGSRLAPYLKTTEQN